MCLTTVYFSFYNIAYMGIHEFSSSKCHVKFLFPTSDCSHHFLPFSITPITAVIILNVKVYNTF